ncbi:amidase family protein [Paenibacillus caui]|uniref:amidase family protein n=1 Tax=Paenibacillus caui TaxID=2873927 RepID=UPI001CA88892|nr:amidase family protein [Paenibacillus caui]
MYLSDWIVESDIESMQRAMEKGEVCSVDLVEAYLQRIHKFDPLLHSVLEMNPDAAQIARFLDEERKEKGKRGLLHGIPILLKDNIDTKDAMHTSAGSLALAGTVAREDSAVAARLREAGAVLLGKTNMTEWANYMSGSMWAGYSARGGLTLNPYGPGELFVGGSSSGSAVAVAANFAAAAVGTETSGSIISPSSQNNLVGIKPTIGLVSRTGIIPITRSQDTAGPIARTVADAAALLGALVGTDPKDEATLLATNRMKQDYTAYLDKSFLKRSRIGIPRYYYRNLDEARLSIVEQAISALRDHGATIVDPVSLSCEQTKWEWNVLRYEFKKYVNDYLGSLSEDAPVHSLAEVIDFNNKYAEAALKYGQNLLIWAEQTSGTLTEEEYFASLKLNESARRGIDQALEQHELDALLFLGNEGGADLAARAGYPSITVPGGYITKGPQGITFVGTAFSEPTLIKLAYGFEQLTKHRYAPRFKAR